MAVNTYRILVDLRDKSASTTGVIAFREEQIAVSVINIDGAEPTQMRLGLVRGATLYAQVTAFTADGSDAAGELSLNTIPLETFFSRLGDQELREFSLIVWQADDTRLLINDPIEVMNNPYFEGMNNPEPLEDPYMLKSVYDVDRNGIVDFAEALATGTNLVQDNVSTALEVRTHLDDTDDPHDSISNVAYNATSWDGVDNQGASKNAIRDKIFPMDAAIALNTTHRGRIDDPHDSIDDTAYNATSWDGVTNQGASKNAIRDKVVTMDSAISGNTTSIGDHIADTADPHSTVDDTAYNATSWNGVTDKAPSKNAVRDKFVANDSALSSHTGDATIHFTEASIDHTAIANIGSNAHSVIDTHLGAAAPHSGHVDTTGNETIAGIKTFSSFPVSPSAAPTTDYQLANKKYVDDTSAVGGWWTQTGSDIYYNTGDVYTTASSTDYFSSSTVAGWISPAGEIFYRKIGKQVTVWFSISGVSNSTSVSFTLPYSNNSAIGSYTIIAGVDNGSEVSTGCSARLPPSSSGVACYPDTASASAWTASGNKTVQGHFTYFTA